MRSYRRRACAERDHREWFTYGGGAQVRTLETVIRLSSAAAKVRLSATVEERDVEVARDLVSHILNSDKAPECGRPHPLTRAASLHPAVLAGGRALLPNLARASACTSSRTRCSGTTCTVPSEP